MAVSKKSALPNKKSATKGKGAQSKKGQEAAPVSLPTPTLPPAREQGHHDERRD